MRIDLLASSDFDATNRSGNMKQYHNKIKKPGILRWRDLNPEVEDGVNF